MEPSDLHRDTWAEVDLECIKHNVRTIKSRLPETTAFMAVVKADGYGHGAAEAAKAALMCGAESLAVAYLSEALHLRSQGIHAPILVLTPIRPSEVPITVKHQLGLTVASADWFEALGDCIFPSAHPMRIHLKFDTGLGRIGIRSREEWEALVPGLRRPDIRVEGAYTHFATAGDDDATYLKLQVERFAEIRGWVRASGIHVERFHCANSAAALRYPELAMDMVRVGAAMYGLSAKDNAPELALKPALSLHSRLIQVKKIQKGESIGYEQAYQASEEEWVGTVPLGYADGWSQSRQCLEMLVEGERAPIIGRIGMDQLMIRLPRKVELYTPVTLIGRQLGGEIDCLELGRTLGVAPQEVTTSLSGRIERFYVQKGIQKTPSANRNPAALLHT